MLSCVTHPCSLGRPLGGRIAMSASRGDRGSEPIRLGSGEVIRLSMAPCSTGCHSDLPAIHHEPGSITLSASCSHYVAHAGACACGACACVMGGAILASPVIEAPLVARSAL